MMIVQTLPGAGVWKSVIYEGQFLFEAPSGLAGTIRKLQTNVETSVDEQYPPEWNFLAEYFPIGEFILISTTPWRQFFNNFPAENWTATTQESYLTEEKPSMFTETVLAIPESNFTVEGNHYRNL